MNIIIDLFEGKVGNVMDENDFESKYGVSDEFDFEGDVICDINEFDFDNCEYIDLNKSDGYRGVGCYEGIVKKNNKLYYLDIINDGVVWRFN
jgi:hypothetical protein